MTPCADASLSWSQLALIAMGAGVFALVCCLIVVVLLDGPHRHGGRSILDQGGRA